MAYTSSLLSNLIGGGITPTTIKNRGLISQSGAQFDVLSAQQRRKKLLSDAVQQGKLNTNQLGTSDQALLGIGITPRVGASTHTGGFLGGVGHFFGNLADDAWQAGKYLVPGIWDAGKAALHDTMGQFHLGSPQAFQDHEFDKKVIQPTIKGYEYTYGGKGAPPGSTFWSRFQAHPLGPILDAATLFSGGASAAAKLGRLGTASLEPGSVLHAASVRAANLTSRYGRAELAKPDGTPLYREYTPRPLARLMQKGVDRAGQVGGESNPIYNFQWRATTRAAQNRARAAANAMKLQLQNEYAGYLKPLTELAPDEQQALFYARLGLNRPAMVTKFENIVKDGTLSQPDKMTELENLGVDPGYIKHMTETPDQVIQLIKTPSPAMVHANNHLEKAFEKLRPLTGITDEISKGHVKKMQNLVLDRVLEDLHPQFHGTKTPLASWFNPNRVVLKHDDGYPDTVIDNPDQIHPTFHAGTKAAAEQRMESLHGENWRDNPDIHVMELYHRLLGEEKAIRPDPNHPTEIPSHGVDAAGEPIWRDAQGPQYMGEHGANIDEEYHLHNLGKLAKGGEKLPITKMLDRLQKGLEGAKNVKQQVAAVMHTFGAWGPDHIITPEDVHEIRGFIIDEAQAGTLPKSPNETELGFWLQIRGAKFGDLPRMADLVEENVTNRLNNLQEAVNRNPEIMARGDYMPYRNDVEDRGSVSILGKDRADWATPGSDRMMTPSDNYPIAPAYAPIRTASGFRQFRPGPLQKLIPSKFRPKLNQWIRGKQDYPFRPRDVNESTMLVQRGGSYSHASSGASLLEGGFRHDAGVFVEEINKMLEDVVRNKFSDEFFDQYAAKTDHGDRMYFKTQDEVNRAFGVGKMVLVPDKFPIAWFQAEINHLDEVHKAYNALTTNAEKELDFNQLDATTLEDFLGRITDEDAKQFVSTHWQAIKRPGVAVPSDVWDYEKMFDNVEQPFKSSAARFFTRMMHRWRTMTLAYMPRWALNTAVGSFIMSTIRGVSPLDYVEAQRLARIYIDRDKQLIVEKPGLIGRLMRKESPDTTGMEHAFPPGVDLGHMAMQQITDLAKPGYGKRMTGVAGDINAYQQILGTGVPTNWIMSKVQGIEDFFRRAQFLRNLRREKMLEDYEHGGRAVDIPDEGSVEESPVDAVDPAQIPHDVTPSPESGPRMDSTLDLNIPGHDVPPELNLGGEMVPWEDVKHAAIEWDRGELADGWSDYASRRASEHYHKWKHLDPTRPEELSSEYGSYEFPGEQGPRSERNPPRTPPRQILISLPNGENLDFPMEELPKLMDDLKTIKSGAYDPKDLKLKYVLYGEDEYKAAEQQLEKYFHPNASIPDPKTPEDFDHNAMEDTKDVLQNFEDVVIKGFRGNIGEALNDPQLVQRAIDETNKMAYNYAILSPFERRIVRQFIPFWGWYKFITKVAGRMPIDYPGRTNIIRMISQVGKDQESEYGLLPPWIRGSIMLSGPHDKTLHYLSTLGLNPFSQFGNPLSQQGLAQGSLTLGQLNPLIQAAMLAYGIDPLTGDSVRISPDEHVGRDYLGRLTNDTTGEPVSPSEVAPGRRFLMGLLRSVPQFRLGEKAILDGGASNYPESVPLIAPRLMGPAKSGDATGAPALLLSQIGLQPKQYDLQKFQSQAAKSALYVRKRNRRAQQRRDLQFQSGR